MSGLGRFTDRGTATEAERLPDSLRRFLDPRRQTQPGEACEMCVSPIGDDHRHVVELEARSIQCVCRPCALLFTDGRAARGQYKTVGERIGVVSDFVLDPLRWAALQVPVGIAFFLRHSLLDATVAFYPSPAGATESELPLDAWDGIVEDNPVLADLVPDTEAALIRADDHPRCFIVPIDLCYELIARLRLHWHGFDGGPEVRHQISEFFHGLDERARPVTSEGSR